MLSDPDHFDARIAGWWVWGLCQWIGSGWCSPLSAHHKRRPWLGKGGRGGHRAPHPSRQLPNVDGRGGKGLAATTAPDLIEYFRELAARLRRVRVACGDWTRVLGDSVLTGNGVTGVVLDPPYAAELRVKDLYTCDDGAISREVAAWAAEHGNDPKLRIALCGYEGEHTLPAGWVCVPWKAKGGYGSQSEDGENPNASLERVWFSPHCLEPRQRDLFAGGR
jgi:hypothetical protein